MREASQADKKEEGKEKRNTRRGRKIKVKEERKSKSIYAYFTILSP